MILIFFDVEGKKFVNEVGFKCRIMKAFVVKDEIFVFLENFCVEVVDVNDFNKKSVVLNGYGL